MTMFKTTLLFVNCLSFLVEFESRSTISNQKFMLPDLFWNTTNPMFLISNTDHIIDVNKATNPHQHDQINIVCPHYAVGTPEESMERHVIYNVAKEEYDMCRITNTKPRIIAYCTEPSKTRIFTISFRSFSPMPGTLEYHPGHSYYFISTSHPDNLHSRDGGYCSQYNMKVVFKVAGKRNVLTSEARDRAVKAFVKTDQKLSDILQKKNYKSYYVENHGDDVRIETDSDKRNLQESRECSVSQISDTMSISYILAPFPSLIFLLLLQL
eukprot:TRINITY_DN6798_c0_g1_i8.p1 TRINITY_DN6798_c0_g1~~TRINITY_DN6798_c0_g1_i8.p1  ORF type:complete len:268 (-),score=18.85 TRINITY_DN6798_c0_g1_i8:124-927(-)